MRSLGIVQSIMGSLSYLIELQDGHIVMRHVDHILASHTPGAEMGYEEIVSELCALVGKSDQPLTAYEDQSLASPRSRHSILGNSSPKTPSGPAVAVGPLSRFHNPCLGNLYMSCHLFYNHDCL